MRFLTETRHSPDKNSKPKLIRPAVFILLGIPVLFLAGSLLHFLYRLSGERIIVGLVAPVNESVFEHIKMVPLPLTLWWSICFLFQRRSLPADIWFTSALAAMGTAVVCIPMLYYFYTEAFGVELIVVDILILLLAVTAGQAVGLHYYRHGRGMNGRLAFALLVGILVLFALFTVNPPEIPLFLDVSNGTYGLSR